MAQTDPLDVLRIWAGVAWCDSSLSSAERGGLTQLISSSSLFTPQQMALAAELLRPPSEGGVSQTLALEAASRLAQTDANTRRQILRASLLLVKLDGRSSAAERAFLKQLFEELDAPITESTEANSLTGKGDE